MFRQKFISSAKFEVKLFYYVHTVWIVYPIEQKTLLGDFVITCSPKSSLSADAKGIWNGNLFTTYLTLAIHLTVSFVAYRLNVIRKTEMFVSSLNWPISQWSQNFHLTNEVFGHIQRNNIRFTNSNCIARRVWYTSSGVILLGTFHL